MLQDRLKWNKRYRAENYPQRPSSIVKKYAKLAQGPKALDIAAGNGRNSLFLAREGFVVDAIDIADAGLLQFSGKHPNIHPICADFDQFDIPADRYDLIINVKFLNRRLFPYILGGLAPGGVLIFQTLLDIMRTGNTPPDHADYYLRPNELLHAFLALRILLYTEEKIETDGKASWRASLVAIKSF